ncbi:MAG: UvrB/UvrC motif-containing protein [Phycisphaerae bacterium]|nr:UvrB/UvrC motif-containing protein [Phycisphaerae bacterium]
MASNDLRRILDGWEFHPDQITVRRIVGNDGKTKIQMRLDLGLIQMETVGRPDGQRPHGVESLLHFHAARLEEYRRRNGTDLGFVLTGAECRELRDEAVMYYHRYLSAFVLEDYSCVAADTARNLTVLDLFKHHAASPSDRDAMEQYRPYIVMMNARAEALQAVRRRAYKTALASVDRGLRTIREFFESLGVANLYREAGEVQVLEQLREEVVGKLPSSNRERLEGELRKAVADERYEDAALLRDRIARLAKPRARRASRDA